MFSFTVLDEEVTILYRTRYVHSHFKVGDKVKLRLQIQGFKKGTRGIITAIRPELTRMLNNHYDMYVDLGKGKPIVGLYYNYIEKL